MACKYNDSITPNFKESIEDMSNSLNIAKPRSYGTSTTSDRNGSALFSSANPKIKVHQVELTDTLQGLSIKYNVTVESIKQLNKIWTSNGLYALREIKIPICEEISNLNHYQSIDTMTESSASDDVIDTNSPKTRLDHSRDAYNSTKLAFNTAKKLTSRIINKSEILEKEKEKMNKFDDEFYNL